MKHIKFYAIVFSPFVIGVLAIFFGSSHISCILLMKILLNKVIPLFSIKHVPEEIIVLDVRLPRVILAAIVGASLSGSGVTLQAIFRNPLVDPYILGISAGCAFGCAITVGFLSFMPLQVMAFLSGMLAVVVAYLIARSGGEISGLSLILSGIVVSAFFSALVSVVKFLVDPHKLQSIVYWLMGSFSLADWEKVKIGMIGCFTGLFPIFLMRWRLNVLSMGEVETKMLGVDIKKERFLFIAFSTISVAVATSITGIIGWVGLMVPHVVRMLTGPDHKSLFPLSLCGGASFMIVADIIARSFTTFDIPVGIITALAGAPFFIYLMKKTQNQAWGDG